MYTLWYGTTDRELRGSMLLTDVIVNYIFVRNKKSAYCTSITFNIQKKMNLSRLRFVKYVIANNLL